MIFRDESRPVGSEWSDSSHRTLLHAEVGVKVGLSRLSGFVAEPEGDRGDVNSRVQHPHCGGVAQRVRSNGFVGQARAEYCCSSAMNAKTCCDRVAANRPGASLRREYRVLRVRIGSSGDPFPQRDRGLLVEWRDAVLAALSVAEEVCWFA